MGDTDIMTVQEYYNKHRLEILKIVHEEHLQKPTFKDMRFEFVTSAGHKYHTYKNKMDMPTVRVVKHAEFMDWFLNGISPKDHKKIRDELFDCLADIRAKTKNAADRVMQAGLLLNELEMRAATASPLIGLVNIAANQLIREDEDPSVFSSAMHEIKCDELMDEIEHGNGSFFLLIPQLKDFLQTQNMSSDGLMMYLSKLQTEEIRYNTILKRIIDYTKETKSNSRTSANP